MPTFGGQVGARLDASNGAAHPAPLDSAQARNTPSLRRYPRVRTDLRLRRGLEKQKPPVKNLRHGT